VGNVIDKSYADPEYGNSMNIVGTDAIDPAKPPPAICK
jgi:hypothetical protein